MLLCGPTSASGLPCAVAEKELRSELSAMGSVPTEFYACARSSRVCVLTFPEGTTLSASAVRELPAVGASSIGIVQTGSGQEPALCLVGIFSGGSAAAWNFVGWREQNGRVTSLAGMPKAVLNNDSVSARTLGNAIYGAYAKFEKP
jgi:hypothetical protein